MAIVAPISGALSESPRNPFAGSLWHGYASDRLFLLSRMGAETLITQIALSLSIAGLGIGVFISPNTSA